MRIFVLILLAFFVFYSSFVYSDNQKEKAQLIAKKVDEIICGDKRVILDDYFSADPVGDVNNIRNTKIGEF